MCVSGIALSKYINFYTDFAFKKIFGTEANKDLLISFLNSLFGLEGETAIADVTYLNSEQLGDSAQERRAIYDVYCITEKGERFIVEMQKALQDNFRDRAIYYSSFAVREQGVKGSKGRPWDYRLAPVYVVGVLNFELEDSREGKYITRVKLKDDENRDFSDNLNFVFLEMPKFKKKDTELVTFLDKWLFVLKNLYKLESMPPALTEGIFKKLFEVAEIASLSSNERSNYEESLKNFWDLNNCLDTAERKGKEEGIAIGKEEGIAIGKEEGIAIGKEEGIAIGKEQGLAEGLEKGEVIGAYREKIENARKLKALGVAMDVISKASGLSEEEIEKL